MSAPRANPHLSPSPKGDPEHIALRRLQAQAYLNLSRIHREMEQRVAAMFAAAGLKDVTPSQANALMILFQNRAPMTARAVAGQMALSEVTVGRFVRALESAGWVAREVDPSDSRAYLLRPTPKAYEALPRLIEVSNALLDAAFDGFSKADIRRIAQTVDRVRANLEAGPK